MTMQLFYSPGSPFARKVRVLARERGLTGSLQETAVSPHDNAPELLSTNPLGKVPALRTRDLMLFDSPVICEYLDSLEDALPMFPRPGRGRWKALKQQAMADGIMDAALLRRQESGRPADTARQAVIARCKAAMDRTLDEFERDPPHKTLDIGSISTACALGYLDLRFADDGWRAGRPALAAWFAAVSEMPALARTAPPLGA
jgi:glutathione S-transferase